MSFAHQDVLHSYRSSSRSHQQHHHLLGGSTLTPPPSLSASSPSPSPSPSSSSSSSSKSSSFLRDRLKSGAAAGILSLLVPLKLLDLLFTSSPPPLPLGPAASERRKTLVLDLDETLIHSSLHASTKRAYDMQIEVYIEKIICVFYVYKRPHVDLFLNQISQWYNLVVFTASLRQYGDPVIDSLDLGRGILRQRLFRESCFQSNGNFMKDLTLVEPDLAHVCIIDNSPGAYALQPENGIPISTWLDDGNDEALLDLLPFLNALRFTGDVRSILGMRLR